MSQLSDCLCQLLSDLVDRTSRHRGRQRKRPSYVPAFEKLEYRELMAIDGFQNGLAPQSLSELAKNLHAEAWISMPHVANDDYVHEGASPVSIPSPVLNFLGQQPAQPGLRPSG